MVGVNPESDICRVMDGWRKPPPAYMVPLTVVSGSTGRLAGFLNYAEQVPSKVTNLQGHTGNYKTLTIAESQP